MLICFITGLAALLPLQTSADEVIMDNGVRVKGTVTSLSGDLLSITSDYAEPIKLKTTKIISITTDNPVNIQLKNGEILKGTLRTGNDGILALE